MTIMTYDFIIVGAGIIGLTVANSLKHRNPSSNILVIEKEPTPGLHASGRNSGILHSGIYYGPGTLKAKVCARGNERMLAFAKEHKIPCNNVGKVIIPVEESDLPTLDKLMANAKHNGVRAEKLTATEIKEIEPYCDPYEVGIYCPDTSIIDSKAVVAKLRSILSLKGVEFLFNQKVVSANAAEKWVQTTIGRYHFGHLFNCAGAYADVLAKMFGVGKGYRFVPFKGIYFKLKPEFNNMVRGNIYPVPDIRFPFLGVHFSVSIGGGVYVVPTAIPAFGRENYFPFKDINLAEAIWSGFNLAKLYISDRHNFRELVHREVANYSKSNFLKAARILVPSVTADALLRSDKVGIRPQLVNIRKGEFELDYVVERGKNSTHVLNAISPAFTSSFEFADKVLGTT